jgi:tetratricopeptide (TPR) repeat protein
MGQEAAATTTSSFIFTRHRRIAQAIVSVLEKDFAEDIAKLFAELSKAAFDARRENEYVPELVQWRYHLAEHFAESGRTELALRIARIAVGAEPQNFKPVVNLAKLLRKVGSPEDAVKLFRGSSNLDGLNGSFYYEWATAEGNCGDYAAGVVLAAYSISDDCPPSRVSNDQAKLSLAGGGLAFAKLFESYREVAFRDARAAVAVLGKQLHLDARAAESFQAGLAEAKADGAIVPTVEEAFVIFRKGVAAAELIGIHEAISTVVPDAAHLDFSGLQQLVYASIDAKQQRR